MSDLLEQLDSIGNPYELWDVFPAIMSHIAKLEAENKQLHIVANHVQYEQLQEENDYLLYTLRVIANHYGSMAYARSVARETLLYNRALTTTRENDDESL